MITWTLALETLNPNTGAWELVDRDAIPSHVRDSAQATIDRENVVEAASESGAQPGITMRITLRDEDDTILAETEHYTVPETGTADPELSIVGCYEDTLTTTDQDRARALSQRGAGSLSTRAGVYRVEEL